MITLRIDGAIKRALVRAAEADGRSLSALIGRIVADWLKAQPAKETRR